MGARCWGLRALGPKTSERPDDPTPPFHATSWGRAHSEGGGSPASARVRALPGGFGRGLFLLLQKIVSFLISFAQFLQRSLPAPERPTRAAPGLGRAAVRADCVSQKRVPRAQRRARPGSGGVAGPLRRRLGPSRSELGRALLSTPRSPGSRGRAAGGVGGGGPGPEGPARGSTRPVRPWTGWCEGLQGSWDGGGAGAVAGRHRVASVLPPSGVGGQTGTMWRPKLSA